MPGTLKSLCSTEAACRYDVLEAVLGACEEMAREGNEGRAVGALFTIGRADDVLRHSRPLILDPLYGHDAASRHVIDPDLRGTVKALAQLDGAFVITEHGVAAAACRYIDVPTGDVQLQLGLGSRHVAAAAISRLLHIFVVVLSQSRVTRVFFDGQIVWTSRDGSAAPVTRG